MLSAEDNEILTRVGPGTPMGNLLRRYWIPACLSSEIAEPDGAPVRVRLLGEDLVAGLPALGGSGDFQAIRGAEKVLAEGEDWRVLGTDGDPTVQEALGQQAPGG